MQSRQVLLHLSLIPSIGPAIVEKIVAVVGYENLPQVYHFFRKDFVERCQISLASADILVKGLANRQVLDTELALVEKHAITWLTCCDQEYPPLLQQIHLPPTVLYIQGPASLLTSNCVAMVGSRQAHTYARRVVQTMVPPLVEAQWTVVSGGALGADTMVHQVALANNGKTVAVLGSGLLKPYPVSNKKLFSVLLEAGNAVVSPFPLSMEALPGNFPARNRIIAGLSAATIVIQAAEKSGALITALFALEQGREVGAVPGALEDPLSVGCHKLIQQGAALIATPADIFSLVGQKMAVVEKKSPQISPAKHESPAVAIDPFLVLCREPQSFDELLIKTGLDQQQLHQKLLHFQLEGALEQDFIGRWLMV